MDEDREDTVNLIWKFGDLMMTDHYKLLNSAIFKFSNHQITKLYK